MTYAAVTVCIAVAAAVVLIRIGAIAEDVQRMRDECRADADRADEAAAALSLATMPPPLPLRREPAEVLPFRGR